MNGVVNGLAATWCRQLTLSVLLDGESPPPSGAVGQYGRHGCVLLETAAGEPTITHDVCLFVYDPMHPEPFIEELVAASSVTLVDSKISIMHVVEQVSGLHTVYREDLGPSTDRDLAQVDCQTDIQAALVWGKAHAQRPIDIGRSLSLQNQCGGHRNPSSKYS